MKERDQFGEVWLDGELILKTYIKEMGVCSLDSAKTRVSWRFVVMSNEPVVLIKDSECFDQVID
jgi:hypothetical protein